jgi:hypothetical protein
LVVCGVCPGPVRGQCTVEQKISACPPQADICAFVSTLPGNQKGRRATLPRLRTGQNANGKGWQMENALGPEAVILAGSPDVCSFPDSGGKADILQPSIANLHGARTPAPSWIQHRPPDQITAADNFSEGNVRRRRIVDPIGILIAVVPAGRLNSEADSSASGRSNDGAIAIAIVSCRRRLRHERAPYGRSQDNHRVPYHD